MDSESSLGFIICYSRVSHYHVEEVEVPQPKGYELLIKVGAAGFCHTDAMVANGEFEDMGSKLPIIGSHEPVGTVVSLGSDAETAGKFKAGDRVGAAAMKGTCGKCPDCKSGERVYCTNLEGMVGITVDGGFAEYAIVDSNYACHLPDDMSFEQAAPLMCAGLTIYRSIKRAEHFGLKQGGIIAFSGLGALGHLGVQFAKVMGYKIVGIDARKEPVEMTKQLQHTADVIINSGDTNAEAALEQIKQLDPNKNFEGVDAAILLADPQESFDYAISLMARHGLLVLVSQPQTGIKLDFHDLVFRDIRLVGSLLGSPEDLQATVDLCSKHGIKSTLVTYPLDKINDLVEAAHAKDKKGKTVVTFG